MKLLKSLFAVTAALFFGVSANATVTVTPTELTWTNGVTVSQSLTATSDAVTSPISTTWTEDSATSKLPAGVTFSDGSFTGTPTEEGEFEFVVNVALSNTRTRVSDTGTATVKITVVKAESSEDGGTETKTPTIEGEIDVGFEAFVGEENLLEAVVNDATDATVYKWYEVVYDDAGETETEIRGATSTSYNLEYSGGDMVIRLKVFVNSAATEACATKTWYVYEGKGGEEGTWVDFECTSPTIPEDNTYRMSTGESVTFTLSPKDTPPEDAQYVWGSFNTSGSFSVLSSGSLTYTFRASSAGNYNISFYAYTGTAPDFDTGSNLVGNWGCTVEVTAPTPTSVTFTGVSPTMPRTGGSYVTTNGYTTVFEASASTQPEGSSISAVNLAWYRVYEDTAAGTVRDKFLDASGLTYSFYASYCNYEESLDYQILLVAYTGTEPDFTSSSNILAQYSWNVTEMARPAPSYEFSIEPGSYEWEIGQTQTISVTERNSDGPVTYTWEYYSTERSLLESGKGDSFSFTVSESGSLRLAIYETTVTVRTNVYWYVTAKSSEGGGGSEGGETTEITYTPTALPAATAGTAYSQAITFTGVNKVLGANINGLPTDCGATAVTDESDEKTLVFSWPSPIEGSYSVALQVFYDDSETPYGVTYALVVNGSSGGGGEEEGGSEEEGGGGTGEEPASAAYSPAPVMLYWTKTGGNEVYDSTACITMKIGQRTNLTVNVANTDGVRYSWSNFDTGTSFDCSTATYEYRHAGGESPTRVRVVVSYISTGTEICSVVWRFDGNEAGEPEGDTTTEKDYLPILAESNEAMAIALENRVSLRLGEFSKPIVRASGATLSGISVLAVGATPGDVTVSSEGVVSGTMTEDLVGEKLTLETSWAGGLSSYVMTNILTFAKRPETNTPPYLAGSSPSTTSVTAYTGSGNQDTYKVFAFDEEVNTLTYKWFFDGEETAYTQNWFTPSSAQLGEVGSTHTVACYACESNGAHQEIPLKTWTLTTANPTFAIIPSTFGESATVGGSAGLLEFRQPANDSYCLRLDVVKGALPPGISTFGGTGKSSDASVGGSYRKAGTYSFTLRGICSNGEIDERDFVITVDGTDSDVKTWTVGSSSGSGATTASSPSLLGTEAKGDSTTVSTITQALIEGAAAGDTIDVYATDGGSEDLSAFRYLKDIDVTVHCNISLAVGKHVPDLTPFTVEADEGYQFKLSFDADNYLIEDDSYGALAPIAKLNEDTPYQLDWSLGAPYFIGSPKRDENGYLSVTIGLTSLNASTDLLHLPDNEAQRAVVFENAAFAKNVKVISDGVLPATITFKGTNTFTGTFNYLAEGYQDEMKMIVKSNATMVFAGGALYDSKLGGLVLEPGATLKFNPADSDMIFYGYRLYLPKASEGKVRFELTGTRSTDADAYMLSARYMGDDDPMNVIEIVPQLGDTTDYRVYRGDEQALMFEAVATPDAGDIVWTEDDNPSTLNGTRGTEFSQTFAAQGGYRSYAYSLTSGAYTWSRDTANTFDNTLGTRELMQASYRVGASDVSAPVEIGFPFPSGTNFISTVNVGANSVMFGAYTLVLQDKGFLSFLTTLSHVYIERQDDSFTVRYGEFASVTLTPDGNIRVAFGPAADTRYGDDPQVPLYWLNDGSVYGLDFSSAEPYAGSNDVIITPSCPPGLRLEGDTLTGIPLVAGTYTVNVKVEANGNYEMTRAFTVAIGSGRLTEDKPVITVTKQPESGTDGYVHLDLNATAEFAASVTDGNQMRWTLDGTPLEVSGGTYTLTAPATRSLDAAGAKIHCLAIEADDGTGRWNWCVRKSWQIVYNRAIDIDGEFPDDLFKYLLNGDEVIVAAGTYAKPIDFLANTAQVTIGAADENAKPVIDLTDNDKGYTRCFRQGYYSVEVGKSGTYEQIYQPCTAATVRNIILKGGVIMEDEHDESAMQLYPNTSANYYGVAGGGVFGGTFQYCQIKDCSAKDYGGGAYGASLQHCVVENCDADVGGGCANCSLEYCTIVYNLATQAGGIDGQCTARSCIILGNDADDYDNTTTPVHLVPYIPTLTGCFTTADGDPAFCAGYHLASGSPATGKGAYPTPDATACLVFVEIVGGGTVSPNAVEGTQVTIGNDITFTVGDAREIKQIYTNGVEIAEADLNNAIAEKSYTLANVQVNTTVSFVFQPTAILVGATREITTIGGGIAAAQSGDTIKVDPGTYEECLNVSAFSGKLIIEAADTNDLPVVNANNSGRCVIAKRGSDDVVFRNMIFENGNAAYTSSAANPEWRTLLSNRTDAELLAYGFGGGVFGGRFVNCTIRNCTAQGGKGGGAFDAKLIGCTVTGNAAGNKNNDDILQEVLGGGVYGGYVDTCNISTNSVKGYKTQAHCLYDGAGTYDAEVRNSFVWDNYIDSGSTSSKTASDAEAGENGVVIHTEEKLPTEQRLADHKDPIPVDGTKIVYESESEAQTAAAKQVISISTEVAKAISDQKAYEDLFEIKSVETSEGSGEYVNKPVLTESAEEVVVGQIETALTADADGNEMSAEELQAELTPDTQVMEKTLKTTTPGLYYALEFSSDMSAGSFTGERHLATGSGSIKLKATSLQTPSGFWRINVYLTPDGD